MKKTTTELEEIKLVGISIRTNNALELNPATANILPTVQKYFHNNLGEKILYRKAPRTTYCVYTEYESDFSGNYTYFIGEQVGTLDNIPEGFVQLRIPPQTYTKCTVGPGSMPGVLVDGWQKIWQMAPSELGGKRGYLADFELYDARAHDHENVILDIYIGLKKIAPA
jgi:predicted transcriptional regulator YdeE